MFEEFRSFHNSQNVFWLIAFSTVSISLDIYYLFFLSEELFVHFQGLVVSDVIGLPVFLVGQLSQQFPSHDTIIVKPFFSSLVFLFFCLGFMLASFRFDFIANLTNILFKCLVVRFRLLLLLGYCIC